MPIMTSATGVRLCLVSRLAIDLRTERVAAAWESPAPIGPCQAPKTDRIGWHAFTIVRVARRTYCQRTVSGVGGGGGAHVAAISWISLSYSLASPFAAPMNSQKRPVNFQPGTSS